MKTTAAVIDLLFPNFAQNDFFGLDRCGENHWQYYVILDTDFWMLDISGSHSGFIPEYPVSSIQHRLYKINGPFSTPHEELNRFLQH